MPKFKDKSMFLWLPALPGIFGFLLIGTAEWLASIGGPWLSLEQVLMAVTLTLPIGFPLYLVSLEETWASVNTCSILSVHEPNACLWCRHISIWNRFSALELVAVDGVDDLFIGVDCSLSPNGFFLHRHILPYSTPSQRLTKFQYNPTSFRVCTSRQK